MSTQQLQQMARRLWPSDKRNQREWLRAVQVVRNTSGGWKLDNPVTREQRNG
jgi:hypothetical protein